MRTYLCAAIFVLIAIVAIGWSENPTTPVAKPNRPIIGITHVLIISVDGLRPDLALRAETPVIHGLLKDASFTFWARTTAVAITLPSHTSMLTGVTPEKHGIHFNTDQPPETFMYPKVPTLFELAHRAGYTTGMVAGKSKFITLARPGTLDWVNLPNTTATFDPLVAKRAVEMIEQHQPQVLFVHLPEVDTVGHADGWSSPQQVAAIGRADGCIGTILEAYKTNHTYDSTFIIITSDHGGAGRTHGGPDPRSQMIPWIAVGPNVKKGLDLTFDDSLNVRTEDTFATACYVLGLPIGNDIDGKPVTAIFDTPAAAQN